MKSRLLVVLCLAALPLMFQSKTAPESPEIGKPAPAFRLNDHTGATVEVGGANERWTVVAFYPKALTPG